MKYNYVSDDTYYLVDKIIDNFGFFKNYDLGINDLINLCGGVPSDKIEYVVLDAKSLSEHAISIEIETNLYNSCRHFNFKRLIASNNGLYVVKPGNWIGTTLFLNQVKAARDFGFERINVVAEGPDRNNTYTGHYKWGRV